MKTVNLTKELILDTKMMKIHLQIKNLRLPL